MMFWQQLNLEDSLLNELIAKEDTTLDRVLAEDDVIQECKTKNEKLLEFLSRTENMHQLINNIIHEPENEESEKTKYYKSYVSCELLSSDTSIITDKLANDDILTAQLWDFIRTKDEINPLLASFFSKVVQLLIDRRPNSVLEFLKDNISLVDDLIYHIDTSAIMDLIYRLVICFENSITRFKVCHWLRDVRLIEKLVSLISDNSSIDKLCNTCQLLGDIIKACRDPQESFKGAKDALLIELEQEQTIQNVISSITSSKNKHVVNYGVGLLLTYLTKPSPTSMIPNIMIEMEKPSIVILESFTKCITENLEAIQDLLKTSNNSRVGPGRLQVVRLINILVQCYSPSINHEFVRLKTLECLWKLFLQYPFNNFLHTQVCVIIEHILNTKVSTYEDAALLNYSIRDMQLLLKVDQAWSQSTVREDHSNPCKKRVRRCGYMGHLFKIASHIQDTIDNKENKNIIVEWLENHHSPSFWQEFQNIALKEQREKNEADLGPDPRRFSSMDSDEDEKMGIGIKDLVNNPLFSWKRDDEDDNDFSFEPTNMKTAFKTTDFDALEWKPVVVPEWKERKVTFPGPAEPTSMQTQETGGGGSSSSEEDEGDTNSKETVVHDPWAATPQPKQEFQRMDSDVSWANFSNFESGPSDDTWSSTPPDGTVLHASPCKPDNNRSKYAAAGADYIESDIIANGVISDDKLPETSSEVPGSMITDPSSA